MATDQQGTKAWDEAEREIACGRRRFEDGVLGKGEDLRLAGLVWGESEDCGSDNGVLGVDLEAEEAAEEVGLGEEGQPALGDELALRSVFVAGEAGEYLD